MSKIFLSTALLVIVSACSRSEPPTPAAPPPAPAPVEAPAEVADSVYLNGRIYTVDEAQPWAEAVAISGDRFVAVGSNEAIESRIGDNTQVHDLQGKFVMPGIFDLHSHPYITPWYGSMNLELTGAETKDAVLAAVQAYAEAHPEKEWIIGGQWLLGVFPEDSPRKEWLDEIVPDRPVALLAQTGHAMWLHSKAMELAGSAAETAPGQLIVSHKDAATGEPTGTINDHPTQRVARPLPQARAEEYADTIAEIFEMFLSYGITSQQTAEGHRAPLDATQYLEKQGRLEQRVFVSWDWKTTLNLAYTLDDIEGQIRNRAKYASDYIYPDYVKIFADGGPFSATSLLLEPYEESFTGAPDNHGGANMSEEQFVEAFSMFDDWGVGVHVHAMGDGTIRMVVDALAEMKDANGDSGVHHKVAHNTMLRQQEIERLAELKDVNIDFSPPIWYPHAGATPGLTAALGEARADAIYPIKSALAAGLSVGQGSDWLTANPTPNPFISIESMITRANPFDDSMPGQTNADEAITLEQAIHINTLGGAEVLGVEDRLGSISVGKFADMIVLDQDLFEVASDEIYGTAVATTILGGKVVYQRATQGDIELELDDSTVQMHH